MIEPIVATVLIVTVLALVAYCLQPENEHQQRHYYHQVKRSRVMADPQRRGRGDGVSQEPGPRGEDCAVYERREEGGEGEDRGQGAIGARELGMDERRFPRSRPVLKDGVDAENEKRLGAKKTGEYHGMREEGVHAARDLSRGALSEQKPDAHTDTGLQRPSLSRIRLTTPDSDTDSIISPSHLVENDATSETRHENTLDQQRRQRVRFDEALRMHSYGGSQYVGRVMDKDMDRRGVVMKEENEQEQEEDVWTESG